MYHHEWIMQNGSCKIYQAKFTVNNDLESKNSREIPDLPCLLLLRSAEGVCLCVCVCMCVCVCDYLSRSGVSEFPEVFAAAGEMEDE